MKTFLEKTGVFLLLQLCVFTFFWNPKLPAENNYLAATIDKHERLRTTHSPRIILIGGSNLAFGIKSEILERELGLPLVNMGLVGPLGIPFMLEEVEGEIGPGDVVVLSLEYELFSGTGAEGVLRQALELRPSSFRFVPASRWKNLIDRDAFAILGGVARRALLSRSYNQPVGRTEFEESDGSDYRRTLFDKQGSYVGHYGKSPKNTPMGWVKILDISQPNRLRIERFARHCHNRHAFCFYSCPPRPPVMLTPLPEGIQHSIAQLARIPHLVILDTPLAQMYPSSLFYDSAYHLTEDGADERTRKLVFELRPFVEGKKQQF
jgi:hypothetical protein